MIKGQNGPFFNILTIIYFIIESAIPGRYPVPSLR